MLTKNFIRESLLVNDRVQAVAKYPHLVRPVHVSKILPYLEKQEDKKYKIEYLRPVRLGEETHKALVIDLYGGAVTLVALRNITNISKVIIRGDTHSTPRNEVLFEIEIQDDGSKDFDLKKLFPDPIFTTIEFLLFFRTPQDEDLFPTNEGVHLEYIPWWSPVDDGVAPAGSPEDFSVEKEEEVTEMEQRQDLIEWFLCAPTYSRINSEKWKYIVASSVSSPRYVRSSSFRLSTRDISEEPSEKLEAKIVIGKREEDKLHYEVNVYTIDTDLLIDATFEGGAVRHGGIGMSSIPCLFYTVEKNCLQTFALWVQDVCPPRERAQTHIIYSRKFDMPPKLVASLEAESYRLTEELHHKILELHSH